MPSIHNPSAHGGAQFDANPVNSSISCARQIHGRPPCPLINFGIGGKVVVMLPKVTLLLVWFLPYMQIVVKNSALSLCYTMLSTRVGLSWSLYAICIKGKICAKKVCPGRCNELFAWSD